MAYTTIDDPTIYFNTVIWSGDSSSPENITVGFEPDWIWGKSRNTGYNHQLFDSVRGFGNDKELQSNITAVQGGGTADQYGYISGTTSTGFTATKGSDGGADGYGFWNESGRTYVAWNWKANGSGATNEDGSINTIKTSASTTSGFSISTYTGTGSAATVGHGLGVVPSVMIVKRTNSTGDWLMYHKSLGNGKNMRMNEAGTEDTSSAPWNATTPTSSVFSVGAFGETNGSSDTFVAYCFAPIKGYSAMGSYTGNGSADGTFVYTGFKPAWILLKESSATGDNWFIFDNKRIGFNPESYYLHPDTGGTEGTTDKIDILSNGFKLISSGGDSNASGATYIYMAFAEEPLVTSTGIPATAR